MIQKTSDLAEIMEAINGYTDKNGKCIRPSYDQAAKKLLSNRLVIANIVSEILEEYRDIPPDVIADKYIGSSRISNRAVDQDKPDMKNSENEEHNIRVTGINTESVSFKEGPVTFDILTELRDPKNEGEILMLLDIEIQSNIGKNNTVKRKAKKGEVQYYHLINRVQYYVSRLVSGQKNMYFMNDDYDSVKKVCSVWFCLSDYGVNSARRYSFSPCCIHDSPNPENSENNPNKMCSVIIRLSRSNAKNRTRLMKLIATLLINDKRLDERKNILQNDYGIPMNTNEELIGMSNFEEYFIDKYNEGIEKGIEKGRKEGILEGRQEGILEGRQEGILEMIRNFMKSTGNSVQDTFEMFKIPETDRSNYLKLLQES